MAMNNLDINTFAYNKSIIKISHIMNSFILSSSQFDTSVIMKLPVKSIYMKILHESGYIVRKVVSISQELTSI